MAEHPADLMERGVPEPVGTLIHVGSGLAEDLDRWRRLGPCRIVLVEPNPDLAEHLANLAARDAALHFVPAALGATEGTAPFHVLNVFDLSSLSPPALALTEHYPGARLHHSVDVSVLSPEALFGRMELDEARLNVLILEIAGSDRATLDALADADLAERFDTVVIDIPDADWFRDGADPAALIAALEDRGFARLHQECLDGSDRTCTILRFDPLKACLRQAEAERDALRTERDALRTERDALRTERDDLAQSVDQKAAEVTLALRMQNLVQNDLSDLRDRYGALLQEKTDLQDLLGRVTVQLRRAAQYVALLDQDGNAGTDSGGADRIEPPRPAPDE